MDGGQNDQPTLKRFSRYNQSLHCRPMPPPTNCIFNPTSSSVVPSAIHVSSSSPASEATATSTTAATFSRHYPRGLVNSNAVLSFLKTAHSFFYVN